jgi:hypothetical protein
VIPESLNAEYAYPPPPHDRSAPWLVYVSDRRFWPVSRFLGAMVVPLLVGSALTQAFWLVAIASLALGGAIGLRMFGGRAGYYELRDDGTLGLRLGRVQPDSTGRRRLRMRDGVLPTG